MIRLNSRPFDKIDVKKSCIYYMDNSDDLSLPIGRMKVPGNQSITEAEAGSVPVNDLSPADVKRADKLEELMRRLKSGRVVQNRDIKRWTTEAEYEALTQDWQNEKSTRISPKDKPPVLAEYEAKLKTADFLFARAEKLSRRLRASSKRMYEKSDAAYESALERLQEILEADRTLEMWLDRSVDFSTNGTLSLCPDGVPRAITSRSLCRHGNCKGLTKREVKASALASIIENIRNPVRLNQANRYEESPLRKLLRQYESGNI
jgi:hypothetical protein